VSADITPPTKSTPAGRFSAFKVTSFRYQFGADLLVAWAIEMEVIILAWYILVTTESALALAVLGALRFGGTLLSPLIGSVADKLSRKRMLVACRACFALLAVALMMSSLAGWVVPWQVYVVATITGLLRPADMMLRQSVIADAVPREILANAIGFSRTTIDSARIVGALAGASLMTLLGMGEAYVAVAGFYIVSVLLSLKIRDISKGLARSVARPVDDLKAAWRYSRHCADIKFILYLAFLVNLTMLCITGGLLPLVAKNIYGLEATGLGLMVAAFAGGAMTGSLIIATTLQRIRTERIMLGATLLWHVLMVGFAQIETATVGITWLAVTGLVSSFSMVPMASSLMLAIPIEYRARIMGLRQLAVFGLPLGLLISGPLIEWTGIGPTFSLYGVVGFLATLWIGWAWRRYPDNAQIAKSI